MQPMMFYRGMLAPAWTEGTSHRFYWAEQTTPYLAIEYSPGDVPAQKLHPIQIDASLANSGFDLAASDTFLAATWYLDGRLAVWGPDSTSTQMGSTRTLTNPSAVAADAATVLFAYDPMGGSPTPGIYPWDPSNAAPTPFATYTQLGGDWTLGLVIRLTPGKLLLCDRTNVKMVDRTTKNVQALFTNPGSRTVVDVRPARPHTLDAGVIVDVSDTTYIDTGRDYYVDITQPGHAPTDLAAATITLANASACGAAARYNGAGVLFHQRYIYEGQQGLFAVDVAADGTVSNLTRLTDSSFRYLEVTGDGDLFAGTVYNVSHWDYYRIGRL
jgi:hypothetical protein